MIFGSHNQLSPFSSPYIFALGTALCLRWMDINDLPSVGSDPRCKSLVINALTVLLHSISTNFKNMECIWRYRNVRIRTTRRNNCHDKYTIDKYKICSSNDVRLTKGGVQNIKTSCALRMTERKNNPIHGTSVFKKLSLTLAESER